ncbi:hypothetical protein AgCh_028885 [Apium graveolens]
MNDAVESEKEEEIQIGLPTDVKHVAHIGNDGSSSSNTPSWMTEFQGSSQTSSAARSNSKHSAKSASKGTRDLQNGSIGSPNRGKMKQSGSSSPSSAIQKPRRQKNSNLDSSGRKQSSKDTNGSTRSSRRKKKGGSAGVEGSSRSRNVTELHTTNNFVRT